MMNVHKSDKDSTSKLEAWEKDNEGLFGATVLAFT